MLLSAFFAPSTSLKPTNPYPMLSRASGRLGSGFVCTRAKENEGRPPNICVIRSADVANDRFFTKSVVPAPNAGSSPSSSPTACSAILTTWAFEAAPVVCPTGPSPNIPKGPFSR
jgi:hypothetical protein